MPKIPRSTQGRNLKPARVDKRPACLDSLCEWQQGGECSADEMNADAFDAEQFVWIRVWDSCPKMALEREQEEAALAEGDLPWPSEPPVPVLSGEGLRAAREAFAASVGLHPDALGRGPGGAPFDEITKTLVAAYLKAVEFGT